MATYNDIKKIKIGDNTFVFHVPTASEVGALPDSTTIPAITLNGATNTSPSFYAPTTAGTNGYVLKSNGSGAPTWTSATLTDTQVTTTKLTSGTLYYPILATGTGTATRQIDSTLKGLTYKSTAGTTSAVGTALLTVGNSTAKATANNEYGILRLYGEYDTYTDLIAPSGTGLANHTVTLPSSSGTLALNTIVTAGSSVFSGGLMSQADKTRLDGLPEHVELTQAEYDALSTAEKNNGTVYFITDVDDTVEINKPIGLLDNGWTIFSGSWTAPDNGIAVIRIQKNSTAGNGTFYLKDTTANTNGIFYISCTFPASFQNTGMFIAEKGHTYETEYTSNNFSGIWIRLYPWNF